MFNLYLSLIFESISVLKEIVISVFVFVIAKGAELIKNPFL